MGSNKKAASWAASKFDWRVFRAQFLIYGAMVSVMGLIRWAIGDLIDFLGWVAWEAVFLPLTALFALVLAYQARGRTHLEPDETAE